MAHHYVPMYLLWVLVRRKMGSTSSSPAVPLNTTTPYRTCAPSAADGAECGKWEVESGKLARLWVEHVDDSKQHAAREVKV